ncbi:MAG: YhjD/YihY/BrkB family envelope integrity protein [Planctomycetota bacterium]
MRLEVIDPFLEQAFEVAEGAAGEPNSLRQGIEQVLEFVQATNVGNLGTIGLLALIYTVIKLLGSIEQTLNTIWGVRKPRTWVRKFADYLSMVMVVPLVLVAATAFMTTMKSQALRGGWTRCTLVLRGRRSSASAPSPRCGWASRSSTCSCPTPACVGARPCSGLGRRHALVAGADGARGFPAQRGQVQRALLVPGGDSAVPVLGVPVLGDGAAGAELAFAHQNEPAYRQWPGRGSLTMACARSWPCGRWRAFLRLS